MPYEILRLGTGEHRYFGRAVIGMKTLGVMDA